VCCLHVCSCCCMPLQSSCTRQAVPDILQQYPDTSGSSVMPAALSCSCSPGGALLPHTPCNHVGSSGVHTHYYAHPAAYGLLGSRLQVVILLVLAAACELGAAPSCCRLGCCRAAAPAAAALLPWAVAKLAAPSATALHSAAAARCTQLCNAPAVRGRHTGRGQLCESACRQCTVL
jgi:hypothetical protein